MKARRKNLTADNADSTDLHRLKKLLIRSVLILSVAGFTAETRRRGEKTSPLITQIALIYTDQKTFNQERLDSVRGRFHRGDAETRRKTSPLITQIALIYTDQKTMTSEGRQPKS